jgi:hypothetical protein
MTVDTIENHQALRPRDLALLLLASGDLRPRQRARDQMADLAGMEIKRRLLEKLADVDPEPEEFEATLLKAVEEIGPPFGPTRAVATVIRDEWQAAAISPEWVSQLLSEAVNNSAEQQRKTKEKHENTKSEIAK